MDGKMKVQASIDTALRRYDKNELMFRNIGMSREACEKVCSIARMGIWDIYHLWKACYWIPLHGTYLEIGSAEGGSIMLADEARNTSKVFGITAISLLDPTTRDQFFENTKDINFNFIEGKSSDKSDQIPDESVDVLFLDGGKRYQNVKSDLRLYWPKVKLGGYMLLHDFDWDNDIRGEEWGTMRAVTEYFQLQEIVRPYGATLCRVRK
jgi:hypothetical protein